jgi:hypothetical protein
MIAVVITALHLACLSQVESGDDDRAVGSHGEVSRWQILPAVWFRYAGTADPTKASVALVVAKRIWTDRLDKFRKIHQRQPTDEELYLLWNCPAHVNMPRPAEWDRAVRFKNNLISLEKNPPCQQRKPKLSQPK